MNSSLEFGSAEQPIGVGMSQGSGTDDAKLANTWLERIEHWKKAKEAWNQRFKCERMVDYYEGKQWESSGTDYEPYTINLVYSTIEAKLPTYLFTNPTYHIKPKAAYSAFDFQKSIKKCQLREDIVNTFTSQYIEDFATIIQMGVKDAFFRFGLVEVDYSADWLDNPNANKPILKSDQTTEFVDSEYNVLKQPAKIPSNERIYVKRIRPENFVCSGLYQGGIQLSHFDACAYWEWYRVEDIKANPNLKNLDELKYAGGRSSEFTTSEMHIYGTEIADLCATGDLVKVYKVFDHRRKEIHYVVAPNGILIKTDKFKRLPLFPLRYHLRSDSFYPMPPATNWKSPQDEYNDAREQSRNHRKRFNRKYLYNIKGFESQDEVDKLMNGGDGTFVQNSSSDLTQVILPVPNADLGSSTNVSLEVTREDFNVASGTPSESTGTPQRSTATQANIISQTAQTRDSLVKITIANWLSEIGKEIILQVEENFTQSFYIKSTVPDSVLKNALLSPQQLQQIAQGDPVKMQDLMSEKQALEDLKTAWIEVKYEDLQNDTGLDCDVNIVLDSMSPVDITNDRQAYLAFLAAIAQYPEIASDPDLIVETAYRMGYRNDRIIRKMVKAAQLILIQKLQASVAATSGSGGGQGGSPPQMAQQTIANAQPPEQAQVQNQLNNIAGSNPLPQ